MTGNTGRGCRHPGCRSSRRRRAVRAATDPGTRGPFAVGRLNVDVPVTGGAALNADVYYPAKDGGVDPAAGRLPVVTSPRLFPQQGPLTSATTSRPAAT